MKFLKKLKAKEAVVCFNVAIYKRLLEAFDLADADRAPSFPNGPEGRCDRRMAVYRSSFGAPAAAILFELLIASGIERLLVVGEAGSIDPKCRIGDIFIPTWGIREEGTSYHYIPPDTDVRPSRELIELLKEYFKDLPVSTGGVWSIDAVFRETADKVRDYAGRGASAVDMECTALMAVAMYRKVDFAAVLVITDELFGEKWKKGFLSLKVRKSRKLVAQRIGNLCGRRDG
jgi:uridine phosphorylase